MTKRTNIEELPGFHFLVKGRHGIFVANRNDIYVGGALITYGEFSELETELFKELIDQDTIVVEIGANIGAHTVFLAKNSKRVVAVEPQPFIFYTLCAQVVLNSLQNVACVHSAIGEGDTSITIPYLDYSKTNNFGGLELRSESYDRVKVPLISLNTLAEEYQIEGKVFLKVDVEGMELEVLRSGEEWIKRVKPIMYVENDRTEKSAELLAYIKSLGYVTSEHRPLLFNEKNFFKKKDNKFVNQQSGLPFASFNELCMPE